MEIPLTPELESFVRSELNSGRFHSAAEVIAEALRLLREREVERASQIVEFDTELRRRLDSLDAGQRVDPGSVRRRLARRSEERRKKPA